MDFNLIGTIAQILGSCTIVYSHFPQILTLIKTKDATGVSWVFWGKLTLGLTCIAINLTISKVNLFIQFTQWLNVLLSGTVFVLALKFKNTDNVDIGQEKIVS